MKFIVYDKESFKVLHILDKEPISITANLGVARAETVPNGDILTVTNIKAQTEKYTVKQPKKVKVKDKETGETYDDIIYEDIEKEREYFTCEVIAETKKYKPSYSLLVEKYIREKYRVSDELAILRQKDAKPEEFEEYNAYAEECKARAKAEITALETEV